MLTNIIIDSDSYKLSHHKQLPSGTEAAYSYFESRGGMFKETVFFGLQYLLEDFLFPEVFTDDVEEAAGFAKLHGCPFNYDDWMFIAKDLKGKLPVLIKAVPEGTVVPNKNILMSIESTHPRAFWLPNYLETMLVRLWHPITVATKSREIKRLIGLYLEATADDPEAELPLKLHDFGSRGVSSLESAQLGGAAHLVNFIGSDTMAGVWTANKYYNCKMAGISIPASEHFTMTSWGKENEVEAYRNMLRQYRDSPVLACVSDSYDIYNACRNLWGDLLRDEVIERGKEGKLTVIRPDSGNPPEVVLECLKILEDRFGVTENSKGYKVLNHGVRIIQGDGVDYEVIAQVLGKARGAGFSASNINFGCGGALLQKLDRDTQKFAFKCSAVKVDGQWRDVFKDPVTDKGKVSKKGRLKLVQNGDNVTTVREEETGKDLLVPVFRDGTILKRYSFDEIRERAKL